MLARGAFLGAGLLVGCSNLHRAEPRTFQFDGHVWSVSFYEGMWSNMPEKPEPDVSYGTFEGMILSVMSRDGQLLSKSDEIEAKAVAVAFCAKQGGNFDAAYNGEFRSVGNVWEFAGACVR
jgi:hypothetical protein